MNTPTKRGLSMILAAASLAGIAAGTLDAAANVERASIGDLVDAYERHDVFRGIANGTLPSVSAEGFQLGVVTVYPESSGVATMRDGYVDYGRIDDHAVLIASSDGHQMDRFGIVIEDGGNSRYSFDVDIPTGSTIEHTDAGTIEIGTLDGRTTTLAPALAVDANGEVVPARYQLTHAEMILEVELADATFPVLVDPVSANRWWGHEDWYSIRDVRRQASWWGVAKVAKQACNANVATRAACRYTVGRYINWIYDTWMYAKRNSQCVHMKQAWTGQIIGIRSYPCNWW